MSKHYRIVFETYELSEKKEIPLSSSIIKCGSVDRPIDIFSVGLSHKEQIELIQTSQDLLIQEQFQLEPVDDYCPNCPSSNLVKYGKRRSQYHDVFTDHTVTIGRKRCMKCNYEPACAIKNVIGKTASGDLLRLQSELGAEHTYRESEKIFSWFSRLKRRINNHDRIKKTVEQVGTQIEELNKIETMVASTKPAKELVISVDGGHINTNEKGKRTFEAMTAVIYRPESLVSHGNETRNMLLSKHCSASSLSDSQQQMKSSTIIAALKQGLSPQTSITALCDGADNCWQIADSLGPLSASMTRVLDWFHVSMKLHNISLPEKLKTKLIRVKWHLWRGNVDNALIRISELIEACPSAYKIRLKKLESYLKNNSDKIVNYRDRQKKNLVFTSNLAESTVESLINRRCKGQQHMRWSREGLNPVLQLRATISSNDWDQTWKTAVMNSVTA